MVDKKDIYKLEARYHRRMKKYDSKGIPTISKANSKIILNYIQDMEKGINIAPGSKKGGRSYSRLNSTMDKLALLSRLFNKKLKKNLTDLSQNDLHNIFMAMRKGKILTKDGKAYLSVADYVKDFKSFWHWYQRINRKKGKEIQDITIDLDTKKAKPKWVYLNEEQFRKLADKSKYEYKVMLWFLYDSGVRSPSEAFNIKVKDIVNDYKELVIRDNISKTFGRRIRLMICNGLLKEYIKDKKLKHDDFLFDYDPAVVNRYLKRLTMKLFGYEESEGGSRYSEISLYDIRHCSVCYWLPRYKSQNAVLYRFGWKKADKISYYGEFLGMKDNITEEDMLIDLTKTEIEKQLVQAQQDRDLIKEENIQMVKDHDKLKREVKKIKDMLGKS